MFIKDGARLSLLGSHRTTQFWTTIVLTTVPILFAVKKLLEKRKKLNYPPGPKGHFLFGNIFDLPSPQKGEFIEAKQLEWSKEHGLFYSLWLPFFGRAIVVMDPDLAKKVLVTKNYDKGYVYKILTPVLGSRSMVSLNGKEWAPHRKAFNPGFAPSFLRNMVNTMAEKLERFIKCIDEDIAANVPTHMLSRSQTFTSDVIVSVAFGEDWGGDNPHPARLWETEICRLLAGSFTDPMRLLFDFSTKRKIRHYERLIDQEMLNILERRLAAATSNSNGEEISAAQDICSIAIDQLKDKDGKLSSDDKISIAHQLKTFYFAGHDTVASTLAWVIWLLSQHDDVLQKLRQELVEQCIWANEVVPSYEQLQNCTYLEATFKETLRLYPPASFLSRYNGDVNDTYQGYNIGGCSIGVNVYAMHRHPDVWKDPDDFRPERFLDGSEGDISSKFLAFSRGPRDCLGRYFAILEGKLAISALALRYDMDCVDPNDRIVALVTTMPIGGALVRLKKRKAVAD